MVRDEEQKNVTRKSLDHISWTVVSVECSEEKGWRKVLWPYSCSRKLAVAGNWTIRGGLVGRILSDSRESYWSCRMQLRQSVWRRVDKLLVFGLIGYKRCRLNKNSE